MRKLCTGILVLTLVGCVSTRDRLNGYDCTRIGATTRSYADLWNPIKWQKQAIFDCQGGNILACIGAPAVMPMITFVGIAMAPLMIPIGMTNDHVYREGCPQTSAGTSGSDRQPGMTELPVRPRPYYYPFTYDDPYVLGQRAFDSGQDESALNFWKPLAVSGDCDSQTKLGILYFLGAGVPQSYEDAQSWWTKGSQQGHPIAYVLLGNMYGHDQITVGTSRRKVVLDCSDGCGVERNLVQYYKWYNLMKESPNYVFPGWREEAITVLALLRGEAPHWEGNFLPQTAPSKLKEPERWRLTSAQIAEGERMTREHRLPLPQCVFRR